MPRLNDVKASTRTLILCCALLSLLVLGIIPRIANASDIYLEWEGDDSTIGGFLTITNFPNEFQVDKTYQVNITITVEHLEDTEAVEFKTIEWLVETAPAENEQANKTLGYSVIDKNVTKGEPISMMSHWSIKDGITTKSGTLNAKSSLTLQNSTKTKTTQTLHIKPQAKITFKSDTTLTIHPRTIKIEQGQSVRINGTLASEQGPVMTIKNVKYPSGEIIFVNETVTYFEWPKIKLVYTNPKGEQINHSTNLGSFSNFTDRFKPDMLGTWFVEAKYEGSDYFLPSTSNLGIIYVDSRFPLFFWLGLIVFVIVLLGPYALRKVYKQTVKITEKKKKRGLTGDEPPSQPPEDSKEGADNSNK